MNHLERSKFEQGVGSLELQTDPHRDEQVLQRVLDTYREHHRTGTHRERSGRERPVDKRTTRYFMAAAVVVIAAVVLWQTLGTPRKASALSDALGIIGQARTIHIRTVMYKDRVWENWYDIEHGREHAHKEFTDPKTLGSPEPRKNVVTTVRDEQYVMNVDHEKRTVRFERLLPWEGELRKLQMADLALKAAFPDVLQYLNRYTPVGRDSSDGQPYDIWRREWRDTRLDLRFRYDIWLSPNSGEIGRVRLWYQSKSSEWTLSRETDGIEINREPPAGLFAMEPPEGYVPENSKATADILRDDFMLGHGLYALPGFMLEDGSILAIWTVAGGPAQLDPNDPYEGLTWGGPLPETPVALLGLWFAPEAERFGFMPSGYESTPIKLINAVGRHLVSTRKADRVYEWALYVPRKVLSSEGPKKEIVAIIRSTKDFPNMLISFVNALPVARERLAQHLSEAARELSEDPSLPASMQYDDLLNLAAQTRKERGLYEDFAEQTRQLKETTVGSPQPVEVAPSGKGK